MPRDAHPTKIICTLGPASASPETIGRLIAAGMDLARLNFAHGDHGSIARLAREVRVLAEQAGRHVALLGDLQGPKIRTGALANGQPVRLCEGDEFTLTTEPVIGDQGRVSTTYEHLPHDVRPGDTILLDDGLLSLRVVATTEREVRTRVVIGGLLGEHKGINLPGVRISAPSLTDKDRADLEFALAEGFDYLGLSFVRSAQDVRDLRAALGGRPAGIIAKIEKPEALAEIEAIVDESDGIMVARGDLGVEMPPEQVPLVQKRLLELCAHKRKPVIVATQMLDSMREHPRPTRAEASDVANAIFSGADALLLSGETAVGRYPVEAAEMMQRICAAAERETMAGDHLRTAYVGDEFVSFADAIARSAAEIAEAVGAAAIVAFTQTGSTARLLSMCRTRVPVFAATPLVATARRCSLYWGVQPVLVAHARSTDEMIANVTVTMKAMGVVRPGDAIVITAGSVLGEPGGTDMVKLQTIK